ncbi:MAG: NAD(P)/FAD-dependent oxidoreductase, partial [Alphaproteobacteria bacterium]
LEAGALGEGASARAAGLWGPHPSGLHLETLLKRFGTQAVRGYMDVLRRATERMLAFAASEGVDLQRAGNGLIEVAHDPRTFQRLARRARLMKDLLGIETHVHPPGEFAEVGFASDEQFGAVLQRNGFGMNPLNLTAGLAGAAARRGAGLHPHSRVTQWETGEGGHVLHTEGGRVRAQKVILAVNGYLDESLHPLFAKRILPVLCNVLVTRPLTDDELQEQAWSVDEPCFSSAPDAPFFRLLPDRRFLFGARGGVDGSPTDERRTREWLIWRMGQMFPAWKTFEIVHFWRGLTARTRGRTPAVGRMAKDASVFYAFGFHGMGLAAAYWSGGMLARAVTEGDSALRRIPPPLRGPARPWHWPDPRAGILRKNYRRDVR